MSQLRLCLLAAVCAAALVCPADSTPTTTYPSAFGTVVKDGSTFKWVAGAVPGVALVNFTDSTSHPSNFGQLVVTTNASYSDADQAKAAGFGEGWATSLRTYQQVTNVVDGWLKGALDGSIPTVYTDWMTTQDQWMRQQLASNTSLFWVQMGLIVAQFDGLVDGHNAATAGTPDQRVPLMSLMILNAIGDFLDLMTALKPNHGPDWFKLTPEEIMKQYRANTHCSALIKLTGDMKQLFWAHSSWFTYAAQLRIYKVYQFGFNSPATASRNTSFSSYAGMLSSLDDFYVNWDAQTAMVQTSNGVPDRKQYSHVTPKALLAWHRVRLANQISKTGFEWGATLASYNSGTYTNQYMVLNLKLFTPGSALVPGTLVVAEQMPGLVVYGDETQTLERGYWPSYNVPFFPEIYNKSGYPALLNHFRGLNNGSLGALAGLDYQLAPRAQIFRRDQGNVVDMTSFKSIMRQNKYRTDPYFPKHDDPFNAICSRGDLSTPEPDYGGCYDGKVTSYDWFKAGRVAVVNGPTTEDDLPAFSWPAGTPDAGVVSHIGQPNTFDFEWEDMFATQVAA